MHPKILVFAGSTRTGSRNARLAARAVKEFLEAGAEVTWISLIDYSMPLYDGDLAANSGPPENAVKLKHLMMAHQGVLIVTPEHNASVPPLVANTLDWVARVRGRGEQPLAAFRERAFAVGSASGQPSRGLYALLALRQVLETGCGALVIPEQIAVARADDAFDEHDNLKDEHNRAQLQTLVRRLIEVARTLA